MKWPLLILAAWASAAGVSSHEPEQFEFIEGHAYMGSDVVKWEGGKLFFIKTAADMEGTGDFRETREELRPTDRAWDRFWVRFDSQGAWRLEKNYRSAASSHTDGSGWKLMIRHGGREVSSQGYNAVPETYSALRSAVYELMEDARREGREYEPGRLFFGDGHDLIEWEPGRRVARYTVAANVKVAAPPPAWEPGKLVVKGYYPDQRHEELEVRKEAWERFWARVESLDAWKWNLEYKGTGKTNFILELRRGERRLNSSGRGAIPPRFTEFRAALMELVKSARRKP